MPLQMNWYLENRVIFVRWPEVVTAEMGMEYVERSLAYFESSPAPVVHVIFDVMAVQRMPSVLETRKVMLKMDVQRAGWCAAYGIQNSLIRMMAQLITNVVQLPFRSVDNLDEAIKFLNHIDLTLPDLDPYKHNVPGYVSSPADVS